MKNNSGEISVSEAPSDIASFKENGGVFATERYLDEREEEIAEQELMKKLQASGKSDKKN